MNESNSDGIGCLFMILLMAGCGGCVHYEAKWESEELLEQRKLPIVEDRCSIVSKVRIDVIETQDTYEQKLTYFKFGQENHVLKGHHSFPEGSEMCRGYRPATVDQRRRLHYKWDARGWRDFEWARY